MKVQTILPKPVEASITISDLTPLEYDAILLALNHCSGGHINCFDGDYSRTSTPGRMYNVLSRQRQLKA